MMTRHQSWLFCITTTVLTSLGPISPGFAQTVPSLPAGLGNDLNYPNDSQRFFDGGRSRMEWEIYLLQQRTLDPDSQRPILTLSPDFFERQEELLRQLEGYRVDTEFDIQILDPDSLTQ